MSRTLEEKYHIALQIIHNLEHKLESLGEIPWLGANCMAKDNFSMETERKAGLYTVKIQGLPKGTYPDIIRFLGFDTNNYPSIVAATCLVSYRRHLSDYDKVIRGDMDALLLRQAPQGEIP